MINHQCLKPASDNFMKSSAGRLMDLHSFVYYVRIGHLWY